MEFLEKLRTLLEREFPAPSQVELDADDRITAIIVSERFIGLEPLERSQIVEGYLKTVLTKEERGQILIIVCATPVEAIADRVCWDPEEAAAARRGSRTPEEWVQFVARLKVLLEREFPPPARIELEDDDGIIGAVITKRFIGLPSRARIDILWDYLDENLTAEEQRRIVTIVCLTPPEARAHKRFRRSSRPKPEKKESTTTR